MGRRGVKFGEACEVQAFLGGGEKQKKCLQIQNYSVDQQILGRDGSLSPEGKRAHKCKSFLGTWLFADEAPVV